MTLKTGEILQVRTFDRGVVERQLVRVSGDIAELTTPEEYLAAAREGRELYVLVSLYRTLHERGNRIIWTSLRGHRLNHPC
jgi:hypothetical protein